MSIRIPDLQVVISRSQDVGKIQQSQQGDEAVQQQNFAEGLIRQSEIARQTVQTLNEAEQNKIDGDRTKREKGDTPREGSDHRQPDENGTEMSAEAGKLVHPFMGNIIDCKI